MSDLFQGRSAASRRERQRRAQPAWTPPMLATLTDSPFSDPDWIFERKPDEVRCLVFRKRGRAHLRSRNRKSLDDAFPELVEALDERGGPACIADGEIVAFDGPVTTENKVLFPGDGITKGDLMDYYERVADTMLPHLRGRPLVMQRFPNGIEEDGFYHKQRPNHFLDWVDSVTVATADGHQRVLVCNDAATLVYLAQMACITPHVRTSRVDDVDQPDRMVFDLDPPGRDFAPVRDAARNLKSLMDEIGLPAFLATTGSRGVHVVLPLRREESFDAVRATARALDDRLAERHPATLTTEMRQDKCKSRLYLDVGRNAHAQTHVAPYAVRPMAGAPVATPLARDELADGSLDARSYTSRNVLRRLGRHACSPKRVRERLADATE